MTRRAVGEGELPGTHLLLTCAVLCMPPISPWLSGVLPSFGLMSISLPALVCLPAADCGRSYCGVPVAAPRTPIHPHHFCFTSFPPPPLSNLLLSSTFLSLADPASLGPAGTFFLFGGLGVISTIFTLFVVPETKNRSIERCAPPCCSPPLPPPLPFPPRRTPPSCSSPSLARQHRRRAGRHDDSHWGRRRGSPRGLTRRQPRIACFTRRVSVGTPMRMRSTVHKRVPLRAVRTHVTVCVEGEGERARGRRAGMAEECVFFQVQAQGEGREGRRDRSGTNNNIVWNARIPRNGTSAILRRAFSPYEGRAGVSGDIPSQSRAQAPAA